MIRIALVTGTEVEYASIRGYLADLSTRTHVNGTIFETGCIRGTSTRIALAVAGSGNRTLAVLVERANALFRPSAVLCVGVAAALQPDIELGDIVVATRCYGYHGGREEADEFLARPRVWDAPHALEQRARLLARTLWADPAQRPGFSIHFRAIASGEIELGSASGFTAEVIRTAYNDAAALETESAGTAEAAHLSGALPWLSIKGIGSRVGGDGDATDLAAARAAAFAVALAVSIDADESPAPLEPSGGLARVTMYASGNDRVYQSGGDQYIIER